MVMVSRWKHAYLGGIYVDISGCIRVHGEGFDQPLFSCMEGEHDELVLGLEACR